VWAGNMAELNDAADELREAPILGILLKGLWIMILLCLVKPSAKIKTMGHFSDS